MIRCVDCNREFPTESATLRSAMRWHHIENPTHQLVVAPRVDDAVHLAAVADADARMRDRIDGLRLHDRVGGTLAAGTPPHPFDDGGRLKGGRTPLVVESTYLHPQAHSILVGGRAPSRPRRQRVADLLARRAFAVERTAETVADLLRGIAHRIENRP